MALGPGLPTRMVCPSPFWRTASAVPMVPPPPDRFSTIADWPHAVCRCAASNRPITSVVPPAAAGTMRRTFSVGRQSAAWPRRGKAAVADSAAAADSTRRRESSLVTFHSLLGFSFAGERRKCAGGREADGLAQAPGLEHDPEKACPRATTRWVGCRAGRWASCKLRDDGIVPLICPTCQNVFAGFAQSIHASDRHATLHGVVFDILVGSESRVGLAAVFPDDDRRMACRAVAREPRARLRPEASALVRLRFRFAQAAPDTLRQRSPSGCAE